MGMCYYMGVGDKEMGTAGGVKREISSSFARGINSKRLCARLKSKDAQMCELRFDKKIDVKNTDLKKLRVKELRKLCDDEGINTKGLVRPRRRLYRAVPRSPVHGGCVCPLSCALWTSAEVLPSRTCIYILGQ